MSRSSVTVFVVCAWFFATMSAVGQDVPSERRAPFQHHAGVCDYKGLRRSTHGCYFVFETFTADPKQHEEIWVRPWALNITRHANVEEVGTSLDFNTEELPSFAARARLELPTDEDVARWREYVENIRSRSRFEASCAGEMAATFENGKGLVATWRPLCTDVIPTERQLGVISKVSVGLDDIYVVDLEKEPTRILVEWGLAMAENVAQSTPGPESWFEIKAPRLEIRTDAEGKKYWEKRIADWKAKLQPHTILPPEEK